MDADGILSYSIMYNYLAEITSPENLKLVHSQRSMGHGVETVIEGLRDNKGANVKYLDKETDLLIIVDSSSNSVEGCKIASEMGMDVVVIDHHEIEKENPYATIVNCQVGNYPNGALSGSAMCYKVCQVIDEYMDIELADQFLDMASIGLISDMMSLANDENRKIVYDGLKNINNIGLLALLNANKVNIKYDPVSTTTISFKVSPAINSCSRYDQIEMALELLTTDDESVAKDLAKQMVKLNERRKTEEIKIINDIILQVNNNHNLAVLIDNKIDSGFRGLIAMKIVERLNKPVLVLTHLPDGKLGGSARSIGKLPLKEMIEDTGAVNWCMGHSQAFGVELQEENLDKLLKAMDEMVDGEDLVDEILYDLEVDASELSEWDIKEIEEFSLISGQHFSTPIFKVTGLSVESRSVLGKNSDTIKITCDDFNCMKFRTNDQYASDIEKKIEEDAFGCEIEAIGVLNLNKFYNFGLRQLVVSNQILIEDYKLV